MKILISFLVFAISFNKQCVSNILNKTKVFFGVDCPDFGKIENGVATKIDTMNMQALHIECNPGFELIGRPKVLCDAGHWENLPQCAKRCPPPPFLRNAEVRIEGRNEENEKYRKGSLATYTCADGFRLFPTTSKYRHCKDGIWTGMQGTCVAYGCQHPAAISNGYYVMEGMQNNQADNSADGVNVGQRAHYNCNLGYMLNGSATVQCIDSGDWSPRIPPQCNKILPDEGGLALPCVVLPSAAHTTATTLLGLRTADDRAIQGTELEMRCEEGYRDPRDTCPPSRRPNILRCIGGTWEGQVPNCVAVEGCIAPANISDGVVYGLTSDGRYKVTSEVWYACLTQGYKLYGRPYLSCTTEGCWEPSVLPECRQDPQDNSSRLSALANGSLVVSLTTALIVTVLVLGLCAVFGWRRHSCRSHRHRAPRPRPTVGPTSSAPIADRAAGVSLLHDPDRVALIAFADGAQRGESVLPTYEEAVRERGATGTAFLAYRSHRPHWTGLGPVRRTWGANGGPVESVHITRQASRSGSAGDSMGSTDTMTPSEVSTNITLDTVSSHTCSSGSQTASCRAICGSLASFDTSSVLNTEGVPLLEESELEDGVLSSAPGLVLDHQGADPGSFKYRRASPDLA